MFLQEAASSQVDADYGLQTSYWLNSSTYPDQILNVTRAFSLAQDRLNLHSAGHFPSSTYLSSIVYSGHPVYGTAALGKPHLSSGAQRMIDVVDGMPDDEILHCQAWGGVNLFGEVLHYISEHRVKYEVDRFIKKLRIYTISDQDNVGPWIRYEIPRSRPRRDRHTDDFASPLRMNFPQIPYIVSLHGFNQ